MQVCVPYLLQENFQANRPSKSNRTQFCKLSDIFGIIREDKFEVSRNREGVAVLVSQPSAHNLTDPLHMQCQLYYQYVLQRQVPCTYIPS